MDIMHYVSRTNVNRAIDNARYNIQIEEEDAQLLEEIRAKRRGYYQKNKDRIRAYQKQYAEIKRQAEASELEKRKEYHREYGKKWRAKNKEKLKLQREQRLLDETKRNNLRECQRKWRENNKEKIKEHRLLRKQSKEALEKDKQKQKKWRDNNKEKLIEKRKAYYHKNKTTILEKKKLRRQAMRDLSTNGDLASDNEAFMRDKQIHNIRSKASTLDTSNPTGKCLTCSEDTGTGKRWCNASCRDTYESA